MASQAEYSAVANAMVRAANQFVESLSGFEGAMVRQYVTADKINAGAGALAKTAVDTLDAFRAKEKAS